MVRCPSIQNCFVNTQLRCKVLCCISVLSICCAVATFYAMTNRCPRCDSVTVLVHKNRTRHTHTAFFSESKRRIHPERFHFIFNAASQCRKKGLQLLILVQTSANGFSRRQSIRETFGNKRILSRYKAVMVYFVGIVADQTVMRAIEKESRTHGDIVQENYMDTWTNLTLKAVSWLKWTTKFCPNVENVIQLDDDSFVNYPAVMDWYRNKLPLIYRNTPYFAACYVIYTAATHRSGKYYISYQDYRFNSYSPFCNGCAFLTNSATTKALYEASKNSEYFWIEDVYQTSILGQKIGLFLIDVDHVVYYHHAWFNLSDWKNWLMISQRSEREIRAIWKLASGHI